MFLQQRHYRRDVKITYYNKSLKGFVRHVFKHSNKIITIRPAQSSINSNQLLPLVRNKNVSDIIIPRSFQQKNISLNHVHLKKRDILIHKTTKTFNNYHNMYCYINITNKGLLLLWYKASAPTVQYSSVDRYLHIYIFNNSEQQ